MWRWRALSQKGRQYTATKNRRRPRHNGRMPSAPHLWPVPAAARGVCERLAARAPDTATAGPWATGALADLASAGLLAAFIDADCGGTAASEPERQAIFVAIAERCLTTALAVSQWAAAVRLLQHLGAHARQRWLPALARGDAFTTVGISQLSTSRQHLGTAAVRATCGPSGWRLQGTCPWVTGADSVDTIVTGAATDEGPMFFVVETRADGVIIEPPLDMLALAGSRTSAVRLENVRPAEVIAPSTEGGLRTGGLATSALAIGATRASVAVLHGEAEQRPGLRPIAQRLLAEVDRLHNSLMQAAAGGIEPPARDQLRADANSLVVRASQAALTASKGAGFVAGHPAERLVREAMFFLVWSCPQAVSDAVMCELSGREA